MTDSIRIPIARPRDPSPGGDPGPGDTGFSDSGLGDSGLSDSGQPAEGRRHTGAGVGA
jgi:hypothetical protein